MTAECARAGVSSIMSVVADKAVVKKEELWDVVGTDRWEINNSLDHKYKPRPANVIVRDAHTLVGSELDYSVFSRNCEHFVNDLRYGKPESLQVSQHMLSNAMQNHRMYVFFLILLY